jgi:hypothetical protein
MGKDSWVEVETTVDTTSIGVQFWGDTNDGWARVLVDGSEVWTGDIYGIDSNYPGGAFVKYLEISGLTPGRHTIRVENMGVSGAGGGGDVCMLLFGLEYAATLATTQVPIDSTGNRTTVPRINVNGVGYALVGVMSVNSSDSPLDAAGFELPQEITVDLEELGLDYVETVYLATHTAWSFDLPNDVKVATLVCVYEEGGPPTTLDLIMGVNTAEWAYENPHHTAAGGPPPHSMPPVITSTPTTIDSDQEYKAHTYAASVSLDPTRTLSKMRLELEDANQLLGYRSPLNPVPTWLGQACMAITLEGRAATQEPRLDELPEFIFGNLETFDFDNDGSEDRIVYTFEPEEVAEDLFLVRSLEFNKTDSELFEGKIVLRFENKGDKTIEYTHIEEIPKSFAESVDDLVFSVPPDEIIDPDPIVMWKDVRVGTAMIMGRVTVKNKLNFFEAGACYYAIIAGYVAYCNKLSGIARDKCLLLLAEEFKSVEITEICHEIENEDCKNLCLGRVTRDKKYCEKIKNEDLRKLCLGEEEEEEEEVTSTPSTTLTITIPLGVHHLGDQTLTDWEVQSPEGTEYTRRLSLDHVHASADLTLYVFQTDYDNPVLVNGKKVGFLCINRYKSWAKCTIPIPDEALDKEGSYTITIQSERRGTNYDDFMIRP